jgi:hypothetical protein
MANHFVTRRAALGAATVGVAALEATQAECKADPTWQTFVNDDTGHVGSGHKQSLLSAHLPVSTHSLCELADMLNEPLRHWTQCPIFQCENPEK